MHVSTIFYNCCVFDLNLNYGVSDVSYMSIVLFALRGREVLSFDFES
jgi:hypothetical protein